MLFINKGRLLAAASAAEQGCTVGAGRCVCYLRVDGYLHKGRSKLKMDEATLLTTGIIIISTPPCAIVLRIASINLS